MTEEAIDQRMDAYVNAMLDSRGLFYASSSVGQDEWRDYVASSNLTFRYPGIQALGYIERVRPEQRDGRSLRACPGGGPGLLRVVARW